MLVDARNVPENKIINSDVCIIGAGAAGITLALEFINKPFQVCLLESGGLKFDKETQSLSEGENIGLPYLPLHESRMRFFGGSTNHWGGWCWPLEEIDFEERDWIPYSGWPFDISHLNPFYKRAQSICQLGPFVYEVGAWETDEARRMPFLKDVVETKIIQTPKSPIRPLSFGHLYRNIIADAKNIRVYLHANVVEIETAYEAKKVSRLHIKCLNGNTFFVSAKIFILATGGIENARLLLLSNKVQLEGLGNQNDLVGRFFMEHSHLNCGMYLPSDSSLPSRLYTDWPIVDNTPIKGALTLSAKTQRREKLSNFSATIDRSKQYPNWLLSFWYLRKELSKGHLPDDFIKHLKNVIAEIDEVGAATYKRFFHSRESPLEYFYIYNTTEQVPNPESRVTLSSERDSLGQNRVRLNWRLTHIDKSSMIRANGIIGRELGRAGLGRLKVTIDDDDDDESWPPSLRGVCHHMGTTRMHVDPKKGVVNENCRVHGVSNLYIAGSSVFPTSGYANPTLTIVALALRLADHVKTIIK